MIVFDGTIPPNSGFPPSCFLDILDNGSVVSRGFS